MLGHGVPVGDVGAAMHGDQHELRHGSALDAAFSEENKRRRLMLGFWPWDISPTAARNWLNPEVHQRVSNLAAHGKVWTLVLHLTAMKRPLQTPSAQARGLAAEK